MAIHSFRASSGTIVWALVFTMILMGMGANGLNPKSLAHEYDHVPQGSGLSAADHDHWYEADADAGSVGGPLEDIEHQLLHFACHSLPLLASSAPDCLGASPASDMPMRSHVLPPPPVELEPPFRPPRKISRT